MTPAAPIAQDWNPETYARFRGLRLRPALDLMMQVGGLPGGTILDLGCGDGAAAAPLRARYPKHRLIGLDSSPAMLSRAKGYAELIQGDAATWTPAEKLAMIYSNAALHWLPDHARLLPRLAGHLSPGGVLAVQMPRQFLAPSHRFLRDIAAALFPDRFDFAGYEPPVAPAAAYWEMLAPLGTVDAWETEYIQHLAAAPSRHPVRAFTESTAMRPFLEKLTPEEADAYRLSYDQALEAAYPRQPDGSCLMPFRRVFFVLKV
jgi:trans-aconitate 2-methyltransferase